MQSNAVNIYFFENNPNLGEWLAQHFPTNVVKIGSTTTLSSRESSLPAPSCVVVDTTQDSHAVPNFDELLKFYGCSPHSLCPPLIALVNATTSLAEQATLSVPESAMARRGSGDELSGDGLSGDGVINPRTGPQLMTGPQVIRVPKTDEMSRLPDAIKSAIEIHRRRIEFISRMKSAQQRFESCTPRQRRIADHLLEGKPNKWIASRLNVSNRTVEVDRSNLFTKMGVENAVHLAKLLTELRMACLDDDGSSC